MCVCVCVCMLCVCVGVYVFAPLIAETGCGLAVNHEVEPV